MLCFNYCCVMLIVLRNFVIFFNLFLLLICNYDNLFVDIECKC